MPKIPSVTSLPGAHASRPYPKPPTVLALAQTGFSAETLSVLPLALQDVRETTVQESLPRQQKATQRRPTFALFSRFRGREDESSDSNVTPSADGSNTDNSTGSIPSLPTVPSPPVVAPSDISTILIPHPGKSTGREQLKLRMNLGEATEDICQYVQELAQEYLDLTVSYEHQTQDALNLVKLKASTRYPQLNNYVDVWPVKDLLIFDCKAGVQRTKTQKTRETRVKANQRSSSERPTGRPASRRSTLAG